MDYDVIVIGAGNGGLSTGATLARTVVKFVFLKDIIFLEDVVQALEEEDSNLKLHSIS